MQVHEYDSVLKSLLTDSPNSLFQLITGVAKRGRWLNVELPKVLQARVDLLFEITATGELILLELQSHNDPDLPLYDGPELERGEFAGERPSFRCRSIDSRELC